MTESALYMTAYTSEATFEKSESYENLQQIVEASQKNNLEKNITGVLFYNNGTFLQIIEGKKEDLALLMKKILSDSRHKQLRILIEEPVDERGFFNWSLDGFDLTSNEKIKQERITEICEEFKENLVARGDVFAEFYRTLINYNTQSVIKHD